MLHTSIYSMISWKISVAQTIQILYWIPRLQQQPVPHTRERSVWTAVLFRTSVWALTCHCWQDAGFPLPFKSPGFMVLSPSRLGCPEIVSLLNLFLHLRMKGLPTPPQENRGSVSHPCCLLCSAVKEQKLALGSCLGSPKPSASQALRAAPFTFGNWAIKDLYSNYLANYVQCKIPC